MPTLAGRPYCPAMSRGQISEHRGRLPYPPSCRKRASADGQRLISSCATKRSAVVELWQRGTLSYWEGSGVAAVAFFLTSALQPTYYPCDYSTVNENGKLFDGSSRTAMLARG